MTSVDNLTLNTKNYHTICSSVQVFFGEKSFLVEAQSLFRSPWTEHSALTDQIPWPTWMTFSFSQQEAGWPPSLV